MRLSSSKTARVDAACRGIAEVIGSPSVRDRFPSATLLRSSEEIEAASAGLPSGFLPFMTACQPTSKDVYAFESGDGDSEKVVVWNDNAVVADWSTFKEFIEWLRGDSAAA